ncbi:MAG TPA: class I SAM-dependent methyltransferase [bacterium]|nr:class I SAM-dependent methyltransferase [bacterium]
MSSSEQERRLRQMRGEVNFRRFHALGPDPRTQEYLHMCYEQRRGLFRDLALRGAVLSPYLEIGAETGANSLLVTNDLQADGIALDISRDALAAMPAYAERLQLARLPWRVCADAHRLPLRNNSLPLAIVWGTLHHFADPAPVLAEIRRVLAPGGLLVLGDEPVRRLLSLHLARTRTLHSLPPWQRALLRGHMLPWLVDVDGAEAIAAGATEMQFTRGQYKRLLAHHFEDVLLSDQPYVTADIRAAGPLGRALLRPLGATLAAKAEVMLFGGAIGAQCRKRPAPTAAWLDEGVARPLVAAPAQGRRHFVLRKQAIHRRLDILFAQPLAGTMQVFIDDRPLTPTATEQPDRRRVALPEACRPHSMVRLTIDTGETHGEVSGFVLSTDDGEAVLWSPALPPPEIAGEASGALACPHCLTVNNRCRAELCGRPCLGLASGALRIADGKAAALTAEIPLAAVTACPSGAIDRPPLVRRVESGDFTCLLCGTTFAPQNGIFTLLDRESARDLYPALTDQAEAVR